MICRRCGTENQQIYCEKCSRKIINSRIVKHSRKLLKGRLQIGPVDALSRKYLMPHIRIKNTGIKLSTHTMNDYVADFFSQVFSGKKPKPISKPSMFETITDTQMSVIVKKKKQTSDVSEFLDHLEASKKGTLNAAYNAITNYKRHVIHSK